MSVSIIYLCSSLLNKLINSEPCHMFITIALKFQHFRTELVVLISETKPHHKSSTLILPSLTFTVTEALFTSEFNYLKFHCFVLSDIIKLS